MREFPHFVEFGRKWADRGVRVMFVSMDFEEDRERAAKFLAKQGVPGRGYIKTGKDGAFIEGISVDPEWTGLLPATVVFDSTRKIVALHEGEMTTEELEAAVRGALGGSAD